MPRPRAASADPNAFPKLGLPIRPPYPPMEAERESSIPEGDWQYEPKWDGFRCVAFREGDTVVLQSKAGQPLTRYFPEVVEALRELPQKEFVIDGEIVVPEDGSLSFDALLQRIHPAETRIRRLSEETPADFLVFDLLVAKERGRERVWAEQAIEKRRAALEQFFAKVPEGSRVRLSPATTDGAIAAAWFRDLTGTGLDGVMAKRLGEPYHRGDRDAMVKVKQMKTAECVVGGFRYTEGTKLVGALLLGLYDDEGHLVYIGHTSSLAAKMKKDLTKRLESLRGENPFSIRVPGGPSRWSTKKSSEWEPVRPELVCEVEYDYFSQGRFRHGSKFLRWRPEKPPEACTMDQVQPKRKKRKGAVLDAARKGV